MSERQEKVLKKIILLILITPLFFIFYKSEIVKSGQFREYYTKYFLISLFLVFYAIFIFFQGSKFLIYNLIILPSVLISFYIFQVFHIQFNKYLLSKKYYEKTEEFDLEKSTRFMKIY